MFSRVKVDTILGVILIIGMLMLATKGVDEVAAALGGEADEVEAVAEANEKEFETNATSDDLTKPKERYTIVLDAGHGGRDPGKEGLSGTVEKELNLAIALKLKDLLEQEGICVVMTREGDSGLYDESASNKKQDDMRKRCALIDETEPEFTVSIHQNSYTSESVCGPQVFYYTRSAAGQKIAGHIQAALDDQLQVTKSRGIKANDTYYLLKKTESPTVIVECGFLSNNAEAGKLVTEEYQYQVAKAICDGVLKCLE